MEMSQSKTILILHGWQSSKEKWEKVEQEVEKAGIKVIAPDLPGFKKENELERPWNLDDYVEWTRKFIRENTSGQIFLLGHSFGGRVAIKFAVKYPEKLSGLVLISAAGITSRPKAKISVFLILSKVGHLIFSLPILKFFQPLAKKFIYFLAGGKDYYSIQNQFMKQTFKNIISENLNDLLLKIKTTTLIIWGEKDKMTPLQDAYVMNKKIKNSKLEILKNIQHLPYLESPELLSEKITDFIQKT